MRVLQRMGLLALLCSACASAQDISTVTAVHIRDIQVSGDLIPPSVLAQLLSSYRNRTVSAEELLQLARSLTEYLIAQGYVNSGVILPDQKIDNGVVRFDTVVGGLDRVVVTGRKKLAKRRVDALLGDLDDGAFNIKRAIERLQMLEREPLVQRLSAELKPSFERGRAVLSVDIEERRPFGASVGVDNGISPNVGGQQAVIEAYHRSVFGWQDALIVNFRNAEGFTGSVVDYRIPFTDRLAVGVRYAEDESRIVTKPFDALDIEGKSTRYGLGLRGSLIDNQATQFSLELGAQTEQVQSFLLGEPFSFSSADSEGRTTVVIAQFVQEWVHRGAARVFAVRSVFNVGLDALDASIGGNADGEFVEWIGQGEWVEKLGWLDGTISVRLQAHLANDELPAFRKYSLGGVYSVRGYRENVAARDNSVTTSIEWKNVLARWPLRWLNFGAAAQSDGQFSVAPFVDYGRGWNEFEDRGAPVDLASAGAALRWFPGNNTSIELQYAKALMAYDTGALSQVLADDGVHFNIRLGF